MTTLREGYHVGVAWLRDACGSCEYCVTGGETLCHKQHNSGYSVNGGFAEYVIGAAPYVAHLPAAADSVAMAPILCAGVTTYKGIKGTEAKPGEWIAVAGIGGLGHLAVQYAKVMGLHVAARASDAASQVIKETSGGAHGVLVTAVSPTAFSQALGMVRRKGTVCLVGLPPGELQTPIFDVVLKRVNIRGSIVGIRKDLAEAIAFAAAGKVAATIEKADLSNINDVLSRLETGNIPRPRRTGPVLRLVSAL